MVENLKHMQTYKENKNHPESYNSRNNNLLYFLPVYMHTQKHVYAHTH